MSDQRRKGEHGLCCFGVILVRIGFSESDLLTNGGMGEMRGDRFSAVSH